MFRAGGQIGHAIRKQSPQLAAALNEFMKTHKQGTLKGNILINRHFRDFDWAKNALAAEQGYDPNVWFDNVEVMASKDIGAETVQYVANILKYYLAYRISMQKQLEREQARAGAGIK